MEQCERKKCGEYNMLPKERECCGTFPRTPHRSTCAKYRGKAKPSNLNSPTPTDG